MWTFKHPDWKAINSHKRRLFLQKLTDQLVENKIQRRITRERLSQAAKHALQLTGYSLTQEVGRQSTTIRLPKKNDATSAQEISTERPWMCAVSLIKTFVRYILTELRLHYARIASNLTFNRTFLIFTFCVVKRKTETKTLTIFRRCQIVK